MSDSYTNNILNDVLITLNRSLLQYLGECSPWTAFGEEDLLKKIAELINSQQTEVTRLVDLLTTRRSRIDFGLYPTEYTDLQFLSLSFLLDETLENARGGQDIITEAITAMSDDTVAEETLKQILQVQQSVADELEKMAAVKN